MASESTSFTDVYTRISRYPPLAELTMDQFMTFIKICCETRNDVANIQRASTNTSTAPQNIPYLYLKMVSDATHLDEAQIHVLWRALNDYIWAAPSARESYLTLPSLFETHGAHRGIPLYSLHPPSRHCTNDNCDKSSTFELRQDTVLGAVIFTMSHGVQIGKATYLTCDRCGYQYHYNYYVHDDCLTRTYYSNYNVHNYIQVGTHHFIERTLVELWTNSMMVSATSATSSAKTYELTFARNGPDFSDLYHTSSLLVDDDSDADTFSPHLNQEQVWAAWTVLALLRDRMSIDLPLSVPHKGDNRARFDDAMKERNERIVLCGQPELLHTCSGCMRVFEEHTPEGIKRWKCQVAVSDGVTIGYFVCKHHRCTDPPETKLHHYCELHSDLANICAVEDCPDAIVPTSQTKSTCEKEHHREMEIQSRDRGKSIFELKNRLARVKTAQREESDDNDNDESLYTEALEYFEVDEAGNVTQHVDHNPVNVGVPDTTDAKEACPSKRLKRFKILLARRRSCCEVTIVRPCGIILARGTFNRAEAVSNVLKMVKDVFSIPGAQKPEHWIYDTACEAKKQAMKDPWWDQVGMSVDVFHFRNKHKTTDEFCQRFCNPADFPELQSGDGSGWWFNTSIAEQVNVWLGSFHAIVREMRPTRYNFFLDEMVRLRNVDVLASLERKGLCPTYSPCPPATD
ncbi:hypothetical protein CONPUDRAFT_148327 [Coniophora puteana RWD-64-598 SS2]|uniref:CxC5 like cysteine cluster associated with KDZ domain-containing protein n=1 Tax=Coniophora puteana (strain RWD-64-598) TaxID=741705 RepID=A0A5M3N597_CONPW|nr:uncharacterized protein CONPUDRAFT_148327 [Coniophora puteana RWD-64-598 SS2]EIW86234.1 hypothetical protein CONPUDRAFT_148327 [Coniophora puteana RWD-64-598 SS2]